MTQFETSNLDNDNIIFRTSVPTFGSSRCGLPDSSHSFLIFSCVYFLSARDQTDQRRSKKKSKWSDKQCRVWAFRTAGRQAVNISPLYPSCIKTSPTDHGISARSDTTENKIKPNIRTHKCCQTNFHSCSSTSRSRYSKQQGKFRKQEMKITWKTRPKASDNLWIQR